MKVATNQERLNELFNADPRNDTAIANMFGVSKQTVSMWRHGTRSPKKTTLLQIAKEYNVSIEWLMGYDVEKWDTQAVLESAFKDAGYEPMSKEARIISGGIDKMPPERREQALKLLQVAFTEFADYFKEDNHET